MTTPSQTVGPYLSIGLPWPDGNQVVPEDTPGAVAIPAHLPNSGLQLCQSFPAKKSYYSELHAQVMNNKTRFILLDTIVNDVLDATFGVPARQESNF